VLGGSISIVCKEYLCDMYMPYEFSATSFWKSFRVSSLCALCFRDLLALPSYKRGDMGRAPNPCLRIRNGGA